jgi:impB/mucB/samB family protein
VPGGSEAGFLAPHPLDVLPDLHPRMRSRLDDYQLELIGEVAAIAETALCAVFGGAGRTLRAQARGIDPRPVLPPEQQLEFHLAHTLATDTNDLGVLHQLLRVLSERLGRRLRHRGLAAGQLRVETTYADHTGVARAVPLRAAMLDVELWEASRRAFTLANAKRLAVRSVALTLDRIVEAEAQLELWGGAGALGRRDAGAQEDFASVGAPGTPATSNPIPLRPNAPTPLRPCASAPLQHALDRIRARYGTRALGFRARR